MTVVFVKKRSFLDFAEQNIKIFSANKAKPCSWGGSRGRVQGVRTSPPSEMTCGFLIQLVFCEKKKPMWFIGVEVEQETSAPPSKKDPGSAIVLHDFLRRCEYFNFSWTLRLFYLFPA